jgi:hypothetical protein
MRPIYPRLKAAYPELSDPYLKDLDHRAAEIRDDCFRVVDQHFRTNLDGSADPSAIREHYPFLYPRVITQLVWQGLYFARK